MRPLHLRNPPKDVVMNGMTSTPGQTTWNALLELEIVDERGRARLCRRAHRGPLRVQRPFYPEGDSPLHLYLLHPPGGLVGGDVLDISLSLGPDAAALVTTPAAQKIYRSSGQRSRQTVTLHLGPRASLEWLPAESILFDGSQSDQLVRVEVEPGAAVILWDLGCFGRPASDLRFRCGSFRQRLDLLRQGTLLLSERTDVVGGSPVLSEPWGYGGRPAYGSLSAIPRAPRDAPDLAIALRAALARAAASFGIQSGDLLYGVTAFEGLVSLRAHGGSLETLRRLLEAGWSALRPPIFGRNAVLPRIWAT